MVPFVGVPQTILQRRRYANAHGLSAYQEVFCRDEGFEHVSRYISGLLLSENKTLQAIHAQQVYFEGEASRRRAMHAAVFEAGWESDELMAQQMPSATLRERAIVGKQHQGGGREIISLDWTISHHEDGFEIYGVKRSYDDVNHGMSRFQTVVTTVIANTVRIDGIAVEVQMPDFSEAERGYLKMTAQPSYEEMAQVM